MKKTVLITGAGGGLGRALAERFLRGGWQVVATDKAENLLDPFRSMEGVIALKMDVTIDPEIGEAYKELTVRGISLDLILNNAGIDRYFPLSEAPAGMFYEIFEINFMGAYRVNRAFLPLLSRPGGRILQISSESVKVHAPFMSYPILKRMVEDYYRTLSQELRFLGVRVILVRPGAIRTSLLDRVREMENPVKPSLLDGPFRKFAIRARKEIGKMSDPDRIAEKIFRIVMKKRTRFIYRVNNNLKLDLMRCIPRSVTDYFIFRILK